MVQGLGPPSWVSWPLLHSAPVSLTLSSRVSLHAAGRSQGLSVAGSVSGLFEVQLVLLLDEGPEVLLP